LFRNRYGVTPIRYRKDEGRKWKDEGKSDEPIKMFS
jgi:hypothetical protein